MILFAGWYKRPFHQGIDRFLISRSRLLHVSTWPGITQIQENDVQQDVDHDTLEQSIDFLDDPADFYLARIGEPGPASHGSPVESNDVIVEEVTIPSALRSDYPESELIKIRILRSSQSPSTSTMVFLTGWLRPDFKVEEEFVRPLLEYGLEVLFMSAPYSQQRTPNEWKSGEYFILPNASKCVDHFRHCVVDTVHAIKWRQAQIELPVVLFGLSVGGILAALTAAVCPVNAMILTLSGGRLPELVWTSLETRDLKRAFMEMGVAQEDLRAIWAICEPCILSRHCQVPASDLLMFQSSYDEVVPPYNQKELAAAMGNPTVVQVPCAHYTVVLFQDLLRRHIRSFLSQRGLLQ